MRTPKCQTADYIFLFQEKIQIFFHKNLRVGKKLRCHVIVQLGFKCSVMNAMQRALAPFTSCTACPQPLPEPCIVGLLRLCGLICDWRAAESSLIRFSVSYEKLSWWGFFHQICKKIFFFCTCTWGQNKGSIWHGFYLPIWNSWVDKYNEYICTEWVHSFGRTDNITQINIIDCSWYCQLANSYSRTHLPCYLPLQRFKVMLTKLCKGKYSLGIQEILAFFQ